MKIQQCFANRLSHESSHFCFTMKLNFTLGRMNVYVHRRRINFQKEAADGITALHQSRVVTFQQSKVQSAVFHRTTIDE
jgi:hypothetical protein